MSKHDRNPHTYRDILFISHRCYKGLLVNRGYCVSLVKIWRFRQHLFTFLSDSSIELVQGELVEALDLDSETMIAAEIINIAYCLLHIAHLLKKHKLVAGAKPSIARSRESQSLNMLIYCLWNLDTSYDYLVILVVREVSSNLNRLFIALKKK